MITVKRIARVRSLVNDARRRKRLIGFVPTMGALHEGHLSLVRRARKETGFIVVSIFVNPTQFAPGEDFSRYPRPVHRDKRLLENENVDAVFIPTASALYPQPFSTYVEETELSPFLCGRSRPTHFRGVCTIVAKLFNIVCPDIAYFGRKDYQQALIIKRMTRDLNFPVTVRIVPTVREKDGLAISSRNRYLSGKQRRQACALYQTLRATSRLIRAGVKKTATIKKRLRQYIGQKAPQARVEYLSVVDPVSLREPAIVTGPVTVALAVRIGKTRLIDNIYISVSEGKTGKKRNTN